MAHYIFDGQRRKSVVRELLEASAINAATPEVDAQSEG